MLQSKIIKLGKERIKRLKWGVAGLGRFSETAFLPAIQMIRKAKVNSLFSNDLHRAKNLAEKFSVPNYFSSFEEFLASDIEAVYIASVNSDHYEQVIKAAKAKKHILCEKPIAMNSSQAEEMVKVCRENNVQFAVDYVYRFHPLIIKAKELVQSQAIGSLIVMKAGFNVNLIPAGNFRYKIDKSGGGASRDLATHLIDLFRFIGGEINSIHGAIDKVIYQTEVDDFASAIVKFSNGGYGNFTVSYCSPKASNRIEIIGHKGAIVIDNLISQRFASAKMTLMFDKESKKAFRKRANKIFRLLKSVNKSFLKNETPEVTGVDGYINMKLLEELEQNVIKK